MALTDAKLIAIGENLIHLIVVEDKGQVGLKVEPAGSPVSCSASDRCTGKGGDSGGYAMVRKGRQCIPHHHTM